MMITAVVEDGGVPLPAVLSVYFVTVFLSSVVSVSSVGDCLASILNCGHYSGASPITPVIFPKNAALLIEIKHACCLITSSLVCATCDFCWGNFL